MTEGVRAVAAAGSAAVLALALGPVVLGWLRAQGVLDNPNHRSSHRQPTVRGAGLIIAVAASVAALVWSPERDTIGLVALGAGLGIVGLIDDVRSLGTRSRLGAQAVAGAAVGTWVLDTRAWWIAAAAAAFVVAYVNATNFMDGINGITGLHGVAVGSATAALGVTSDHRTLAVGGAVLAGASIGFLPVNLPAARAFPGDVGSYFVGAWIAGLVAVGLRADLAMSALLGPTAIYLADTGWVLAKRAARGARLSEPHREHVYQRLVDAGWSHAPTAALVAVATAGTAASGRLGNEASGWWIVAGVALALGYLALPRVVSHPNRERAA